MSIYNDNLYEYIDNYKNDILATLKDYDIEATEKNIITEAQSCIDSDYEYLKDILIHFDRIENKKIFVCGVLGLWNSKPNVKKVFNSLYSAVVFCLQDINELYFKKNNTTLQLSAAHHDGINTFKFYKLIKGKKYAIKYDDIYNI